MLEKKIYGNIKDFHRFINRYDFEDSQFHTTLAKYRTKHYILSKVYTEEDVKVMPRFVRYTNPR